MFIGFAVVMAPHLLLGIASERHGVCLRRWCLLRLFVLLLLSGLRTSLSLLLSNAGSATDIQKKKWSPKLVYTYAGTDNMQDERQKAKQTRRKVQEEEENPPNQGQQTRQFSSGRSFSFFSRGFLLASLSSLARKMLARTFSFEIQFPVIETKKDFHQSSRPLAWILVHTQT